jgi:hypothetical protein
MYTIWVFFTTLPTDRGWLVALSNALRGNSRLLESKAISLLTRSPIVHVSIGDGHTVLSVSLEGRQVWPFAAYVERYPGLAWAVAVPVARVPALSTQSTTCRYRRLPTLCRWLSNGTTMAQDCVSVVGAVLAAHGVKMPHRVTTPAQVLDWLRSEGYELVDLDMDWHEESSWKHRHSTRLDA